WDRPTNKARKSCTVVVADRGSCGRAISGRLSRRRNRLGTLPQIDPTLGPADALWKSELRDRVRALRASGKPLSLIPLDAEREQDPRGDAVLSRTDRHRAHVADGELTVQQMVETCGNAADRGVATNNKAEDAGPRVAHVEQRRSLDVTTCVEATERDPVYDAVEPIGDGTPRGRHLQLLASIQRRLDRQDADGPRKRVDHGDLAALSWWLSGRRRRLDP